MVSASSSQAMPGPFPIPAAAVASHPGVMLTPRQLRRWIDELPLGNPPKAGNLLLQQLRLLVRDPQPGGRFAALLDLYDVPLQQLLEIVRERLPADTDNALPLDQLENLSIELLTELAYGHLRIANHMLAAGKSPTTGMLFRAMRLLDDALGIQRLHYCRLEPEHWQLMLRIFQHAAYRQAENQRVEHRPHQAGDPDSIHGLFFRALVISLCDPHHRRPSELLAWCRWAGQHTNLLGLAVLPQGAFAIPLDISGALSPLAGARAGKPGTQTRYLTTDRFLQQLQDEPGSPEGLHRALTDLIKGRKTSEQRRTERQARNHPYRLLYGLRNIHRRLSDLTQGAVAAPDELTPVLCRQINQSKTGAAFRLQGPLNPPLAVGEPILAEAESSAGSGPAVGFAAIIRHLAGGANQQIEIGVEKIQGHLVPLTVIGAAADRARGDNHALLEHARETGRYSLIAARSVYRDGDMVAAEGPSMRYNLRMLRLLGTIQHTAFIEVEPTDN